MSTVLAYILISGLILLPLYLIYKWLLSNETFHRFNRIYLLGSYAVAFGAMPVKSLLEWLRPTGAEGRAGGVIPEINIGEVSAGVMPDASRLPSWLITLIFAVYIAGVLFCAVQTLIVLFHIKRVIRRGEVMNISGHKVIVTDNCRLTPFSYAGNIIMTHEDYENNLEMILIHESSHNRLRHWVDLVIAQMVIITEWFNPASWLMRDELRVVHEYEADEAVLSKGADAKKYQLLLIRKAVGKKFPALANCLNHSNLKKRITMMMKTKSRPAARMRALVAVPAVVLAAMSINVTAVASVFDRPAHGQSDEMSRGVVAGYIDKDSKKASDAKTESENVSDRLINVEQADAEGAVSQPQEDITKVTRAPEVMPKFPGGEAAMMKFLSENIRYPKEAMDNNIQGRVVVQFTVTKTGEVRDPKVVRSVKGLDEEAMAVVMKMPNFEPGRVGGEPVNCIYTLPVSFRLMDDSKAEAETADAKTPAEVKK